jgi:hypothetical protein
MASSHTQSILYDTFEYQNQCQEFSHALTLPELYNVRHEKLLLKVKSYRFGLRTDNSAFVTHSLAPAHSHVCPKSSPVSLRLIPFGVRNIGAGILTACPTDRRAVLLTPVTVELMIWWEVTNTNVYWEIMLLLQNQCPRGYGLLR